MVQTLSIVYGDIRIYLHALYTQFSVYLLRRKGSSDRSTRLKKSETRPIPPPICLKVAVAREGLVGDTGESGEAYDAEVQTEAELNSVRAYKT